MVLLVAVAVVLATVPLRGGRLAALAELRLRAVSALVAAALLQAVVALAPVDAPAALLRGLHLLSYACAAVAVVANRRIPGALVIASGGAANLAAIAANGGVMPAAPGALQRAGLAPLGEGFSNSAAVTDARLALLGDVFAIPAGWPLSNVFSVGDVLLVVGAVVLIHRVCRRPRPQAASSGHPQPVPAGAAAVAPTAAVRQGGRPPRSQEPAGGPAHVEGLDDARARGSQGGAGPRRRSRRRGGGGGW